LPNNTRGFGFRLPLLEFFNHPLMIRERVAPGVSTKIERNELANDFPALVISLIACVVFEIVPKMSNPALAEFVLNPRMQQTAAAQQAPLIVRKNTFHFIAPPPTCSLFAGEQHTHPQKTSRLSGH
jgi:hypothetical protein